MKTTRTRAGRKRGDRWSLILWLFTWCLLMTACVAGPDAGGSDPSNGATPTSGAPSASAAVQSNPSPTSAATPTTAISVAIAQGVPPSVNAKPWAAGSRSGAVYGGKRLGQSARLAAGNERLMMVNGEAALTQDMRDGTLHLRGLAGSMDRSISMAAGGRITNATRWVSAVPSGQTVLLSGATWDGNGRDTGIAAIDLASGSWRQIADPGPSAPASLGPDVFRVVALDPSGSTGATALCDGATCVVSAFDPSTGRASGSVMTSEGLVAVNGGSAIVMSQTRLRAIDLATGKTVWELADAEFQEGFRLDDQRWVQSYIDHADGWAYTVALIDLATGKRNVVWTAPVDQNRVLYHELSTADAIAFGSDALSLELDSASVSASILDLQSGRVFEDAVRLSTARQPPTGER